MLRITFATITAFFFISSNPVKAEESSQTEEGFYQTGFGLHTYVLDGELSDNSSSMFSGFAGSNWSGRRIVGVRFSYADYTVTRTIDNFIVDEESKAVISITSLIRWRFRAQDKLQPFLDAGIGITDQYAGVGDFKLALTFGLGIQYKVTDSWGLFIESRGIGWDQEEMSVRDSHKDIATNEFTLGYMRFFN